ncbi:MAG: sulfur carrier protein ThiS [Candidatus Omnitrophica bacterium]|nr:hypothetical protein [bacterium]NUN96913.1 sulfur carrier protein ThiS [Candidatus Omnitrophota bacterium]
MNLTINGKSEAVESVRTLADLLARLNLDQRQVVVELNERIIRRNDVEGTLLSNEDRLEILRFVGGG